MSAFHTVLPSTPPDQYHDIVEITNQPAVQINVGRFGQPGEERADERWQLLPQKEAVTAFKRAPLGRSNAWAQKA